jgi:spore maturation protein B
MSIVNAITTSIMPLSIGAIIVFGLKERVQVFDCFMSGAKEGIETLFRILPSLIGIVTAISMLRASGLIDVITNLLSPILGAVGFPAEIFPLAIMRPISGSGSMGIVNDVLKSSGPDSFLGRVVSVMMGSTETTFYTLAIYFGSVGITRTRYTMWCALLADATAILASVYLVKLFFV